MTRPISRIPNIRWAGEGIDLNSEELVAALEEISKLAVECNYKATAVKVWALEDFGIEGMMNDPFGAKLACRRSPGIGKTAWDIPPLDAISVSFTGNSIQGAINLTFAHYPAEVKYRDHNEKTQVFRTNISKGWSIRGSAHALSAVSISQEEAARTHGLLLSLLLELESKDSRIMVDDMGGYSRNHDSKKLYERMRYYLAVSAVEVSNLMESNPALNRDELTKIFPVLTFPDFEGYEMEGEFLLAKEERDNRGGDEPHFS